MLTSDKMRFRKPNQAFTLIELLTVVAIIGILATILIPTVGMVQKSANKARTKNQFGQWAVAMESFKSEYGYYPVVAVNNKKIDAGLFVGALSAKKIDGSPLTSSATDVVKLAGNTKRIAFSSFSDQDISSLANGDAEDGKMRDGFGNIDIAVITDKNGDGRIYNQSGADESLVAVASASDIGRAFTPSMPTNGIRAGVIFYSAGAGGSDADVVTSW